MLGKRILIVGTSGSGKSTLSKKLASLFNIPQIELDALHWGTNWTSTPPLELNAKVFEAINSSDSWTCDGNYSVVRETLWSHADTVIWLDYPKWIVMKRMVLRTLKRAFMRETLWAGNRESIWNIFKRNDENIILWAWNTHAKHRRNYPALFAKPEYDHLQVVILKHPKEADALLRKIGFTLPDKG